MVEAGDFSTDKESQHFLRLGCRFGLHFTGLRFFFTSLGSGYFLFAVRNTPLVLLSVFIFQQTIKARPTLGVFDYNQTFLTQKDMSTEEQFVNWYPYTNGTISSYIQGATSRNRWLLLTLQPMVNPSIGTAPNLLTDIRAGRYDTIITTICSEINSQNASVFIRWGHEMETSQSRYPWSGQPPAEYIAAFQHVVLLMRSLLSLACYFVWSPAGNSNAPSYWVGSAFCNYIGFSLYSYREYDINEYGFPQSFQTLINARYHIAAICNASAPIMLCEMGAYSSKVSSYQNTWIKTALSLMQDYPLLKIAVAFNAPDSVAWTPAGIPDWSISPTLWNASHL
jgi:beta-mannanase